MAGTWFVFEAIETITLNTNQITFLSSEIRGRSVYVHQEVWQNIILFYVIWNYPQYKGFCTVFPLYYTHSRYTLMLDVFTIEISSVHWWIPHTDRRSKKWARYNVWYVQFLKCCRVKEFNDAANLPLHKEEDFKTWILIH